jgi:hypothetical protein
MKKVERILGREKMLLNKHPTKLSHGMIKNFQPFSEMAVQTAYQRLHITFLLCRKTKIIKTDT